MAACDLTRPLTQAQIEAGFDQQRTGVGQALRPFSGSPTIENLLDYINRELVPVLRATRNAANDVWKQVVDNAPSANPLAFYFSTTTTNADPTAGRVRLDQAVQNTATVIRVSESNGRLQSVQPWLDVMSGGPTTPLGTVTLLDAINPGRFLRFDLNTMTDQGAYWDLGVTFIEGSDASPFVDDEAVTIGFIAGVSAAGSTVPVGSLTPVARDTFIGNITNATAAPVAVPLANIDSTSIVYDGTAHEMQRAALTGDVTASANANATTIANDAVTNAKLANMAARTVKLRNDGAGTGDPIDGTGAQVGEILRFGTFTDDSTSTGAVTTYTLTEAVDVVRFLSGIGDITIHGATVPAEAGKIVFWDNNNDSGQIVLFKNNSGSAAAATNRFFGPELKDMTLTPGERAVSLYFGNRHRFFAGPQPGRLKRFFDLSGSGTYTPSTDCRSFYVEMWGGGGGAGGAVAAAAQTAVGAGGGGGGYCSFYVDTLASSYSYSVGGGGTAGSSSGGDGGAGSNTTFDSATAQGGSGGEGSAHATRGSGSGTTFAMTGPGGPGGTGNVTVPSGGTVIKFGRGFPGMPGFRQTGTVAWGGAGGAAGGGKGPTGAWNLTSNQAGGSGSTGSGSGGDGGFSSTATGRAGGGGGSGRVLVWEFS